MHIAGSESNQHSVTHDYLQLWIHNQQTAKPKRQQEKAKLEAGPPRLQEAGISQSKKAESKH